MAKKNKETRESRKERVALSKAMSLKVIPNKKKSKRKSKHKDKSNEV